MKLFISFGLLILALFSTISTSAATPAATAAATQPVLRKFAVVPLGNPRSLAIDAAGNLFVGDVDGGKVIKITPAGDFSTLGAAGASLISDPLGVAVGRNGTVYVADATGNGVYRIPPGGTAAAFGKTEGVFSSPTGVAVDAAGNVYATNNADNTILKITPEGVVSVFAGSSGASGSVDGAGAAASFMRPRGIAIDAKDNLFVADEGGCNIRKITPAGVVTTVAGKEGEAGSTDGQGAAARFGAPRSLAAAADGTLYIADTDNHLIRKITPQGAVTTLAGKAGEFGSADGQGAAARFNEPRGIAVDAAGNVYVADTGNAAIRQITPAGVVTTITGAAPATAPAATTTATKP